MQAVFFKQMFAPKPLPKLEDHERRSRAFHDPTRPHSSEARSTPVLKQLGTAQSFTSQESERLSVSSSSIEHNKPGSTISTTPLQAEAPESPNLQLTETIGLQAFEVAGHWSGRGQHVEFQRREAIPLEEGKLLGRGASADVHEVTCRGVTIARKQIYCSLRMKVEDVRRELDILKKLDHRHVVILVGSYIQGKVLGLLLFPAAVCDLGVLLEEIEDEQKNDTGIMGESLSAVLERLEIPQKSLEFAYRRLKRVYGCLAMAVQYLHDNNIRHKDLKPRNILLDRNDGLFITDFGISRDKTDASTSVTTGMERGTYRYCAPEVAGYEPRGRAADVYSLGCVFLEIHTVEYGMSLSEFDDLRSKGDDDRSFQNSPEKIKEWIIKLRRAQLARPRILGNQQIFYMFDLIENMIDENAAFRPLIGAISSNLLLMERLQSKMNTESYFGRCCQFDVHGLEECEGLQRDFLRLRKEISDEKDQVNNLQARFLEERGLRLSLEEKSRHLESQLIEAREELSISTIQHNDVVKKSHEERYQLEVKFAFIEGELVAQTEALDEMESVVQRLEEQRDKERVEFEVLALRERSYNKDILEIVEAAFKAEKSVWLEKESDINKLFGQVAEYRAKHGK